VQIPAEEEQGFFLTERVFSENNNRVGEEIDGKVNDDGLPTVEEI